MSPGNDTDALWPKEVPWELSKETGLSRAGDLRSVPDPFRYFRTSPEIIRLAVMLYVRFPLSLRYVEDLLHERVVDISHETVRYWWHRFGPMFAAATERNAPDSYDRDRNGGGLWSRYL